MRWLVAGALLAYGIATFDLQAPRWAIASLALFAALLALQCTRWTMLRIYALWFGAFLVVQALLTPHLRGDFITLPPEMHSTVDVRTRELPGISPSLRHISTDERGFRVNPRVDYRAKRGWRIFTIGASTTEDIVHDDEATWSHLLQQAITARGQSAEVINTGVSGLRAINHLATLQRITQLDPDLAILLIGTNDWVRHIREHFAKPQRTLWKPVALNESVLGRLLEDRVISPLRRRITGKASSDRVHVVDGIEGLIFERPSVARPVTRTFRPARVADDYAATLREISRWCKESRLTCLFLTQPHAYGDATPAELRAHFWMTPAQATYTLDFASMAHIATLYNEFLKSFAAQEGHPVCDLAARIAPLPRFFYDEVHFTDEGAHRVAELVLPCVVEALERSAGSGRSPL